jgi:hypothetical protein
MIPLHATKESIHEPNKVDLISCNLWVQKNKSNVEIRRPAAHGEPASPEKLEHEWPPSRFRDPRASEQAVITLPDFAVSDYDLASVILTADYLAWHPLSQNLKNNMF